jgi:hypothetical protein
MHDEEESDIDDGLANSLGVLRMDPVRSKHIYLGEEHWHTILMDIAEVKNYFANHKKDLEKSYERIKLAKPQIANQPPTLLMGATPATEVELRAELPPKSTVLALCARYFSSMDNAPSIVHAPTLHQQLRNHWQDPSKTPIMWLGMLYSILCLAMLSYHKVGDEPPEWKGRVLELANEYRLRTVQCLIAGDYTRPSAYTVEAMLLYSFCEFSSRWDADLSLWIIGSITVRIALRMGYHRDGKWFPTLTPFEAVCLFPFLSSSSASPSPPPSYGSPDTLASLPRSYNRTSSHSNAALGDETQELGSRPDARRLFFASGITAQHDFGARL